MKEKTDIQNYKYETALNEFKQNTLISFKSDVTKKELPSVICKNVLKLQVEELKL